MSRQADLWGKAASNARIPFKRLYLDTEPLRHANWPLPSLNLRFCLIVAEATGVEVCVPEAARLERSEQWVRETLDKIQSVRAKVTALQQVVSAIGAKPVAFSAPSEEELRSSYAAVETEAVKTFQVQLTPYGSLALDEVFRMAVAREFTFEEKGDRVVGIQDCVILLSVLDHLRANPAPAAFVSKDGVFERLPMLTPKFGVELALIPGMDALNQMFDQAHEEAYKAVVGDWWKSVTERIRAALNGRFSEIETFLLETIKESEVEALFTDPIVSKDGPKVERLGAILPEIKGAEGEPIQFACNLIVRYSAILERRPLSLATLVYGVQGFPELPEFPVHVEESMSVTVELNAEVDPDYANLRLKSATISGPKTGSAGRLTPELRAMLSGSR